MDKEVGYIYVLKWRGIYKIGCSVNYERRLKSNKIKKPTCELIKVYKCENHTSIEKQLHNIFDYCRLSGNNEWFCMYKEDVEYLNLIIDDNDIFTKVIDRGF